MKLTAIEARDLNDIIVSISNKPGIDGACIDCPTNYSGFSIEEDTANVPTLVMEIGDAEDPLSFVVTLQDSVNPGTYQKQVTTEFAGRRPVHHPR